jgi:hypothetical protein
MLSTGVDVGSLVHYEYCDVHAVGNTASVYNGCHSNRSTVQVFVYNRCHGNE